MVNLIRVGGSCEMRRSLDGLDRGAVMTDRRRRIISPRSLIDWRHWPCLFQLKHRHQIVSRLEVPMYARLRQPFLKLQRFRAGRSLHEVESSLDVFARSGSPVLIV